MGLTAAGPAVSVDRKCTDVPNSVTVVRESALARRPPPRSERAHLVVRARSEQDSARRHVISIPEPERAPLRPAADVRGGSERVPLDRVPFHRRFVRLHSEPDGSLRRPRCT